MVSVATVAARLGLAVNLFSEVSSTYQSAPNAFEAWPPAFLDGEDFVLLPLSEHPPTVPVNWPTASTAAALRARFLIKDSLGSGRRSGSAVARTVGAS
ncbi:hypothetical protein ACWCP8_22325 [Streptomyces sp. NPDC002206]